MTCVGKDEINTRLFRCNLLHALTSTRQTFNFFYPKGISIRNSRKISKLGSPICDLSNERLLSA